MLRRESGVSPHSVIPVDMTRDIETLESELRTEHDRYVRVLADLTNCRRRTEREGSKRAEDGKREILLRLLEVVDDMEKALRWAGAADQPFVDGVRHIHQKLRSLLEAQGVHSFESIHTMFDHALHHAVAVAEHSGHPAGTIVDELCRGYLWQADVLHVAQVRVAG